MRLSNPASFLPIQLDVNAQETVPSSRKKSPRVDRPGVYDCDLGEEGKSFRMWWSLSMPTYQVLHPPYSGLYVDASFSWSLLIGYLMLATVAGLWAVWDTRRPPTHPKPRA